MSSIRLSGNRIVQRLRGNEEELGRIELDPNSQTYVLWLRDTFGVANTAGALIRADEYPSLDDAKAKVLQAPSVFIWHCVWMRSVVKHEAERVLDEHWDELGAGIGAASTKASMTDRIRALIDRLPRDKLGELFEKIGTAALMQALKEFMEGLIGG